MQLSSNHWSLTLDLNGGRITELSHKGVKVFGTYHRMDGKQGNTHICAPSFDREGQEKWGLPFHGYARTLTWSVESQTEHSVSIGTITPSSNLYSAELKLMQTFVLGKSFCHSVSVTHLSGKAVPVNVGLHYYWDTPQGWGETMVNKKNVREGIETNGYMAVASENEIVFPHARYRMTSDGFHTAMLWTSFKTGENGMKEYSQDFCCIEPIIKWPNYFGAQQSLLNKGEVKTASISLVPQEGLEPPSL